MAIEGYGYDKITHAYAYGGPELAIKTINQNFNLDIKNYVTVNFHQMAEIVDAFGGVDMDLTADEVYQLNQNLWTLSQESPGTVVSSDYILNIYGEMDLINGPFEGGTYHLNGNQAVAYARIRHIDSDDVRASRQQEDASGPAAEPEEKEHIPDPRPGPQGLFRLRDIPQRGGDALSDTHCLWPG